MIAEDVLERGLTDAAAGFEVPVGAVERLRDQLAPSTGVTTERTHLRLLRSRRAWAVASAAALVILVVVAIAIGGATSGPSHNDTQSGLDLSPKAAPPAPVAGAVAGSNAVAGGASGGAAAHAPAVTAVPAPVAGAFGTARDATKTPSLAPDDSGAKVVKTGEMDLQAPKGQVSHVIDRLGAIATLESGYVADSHSSEGGDASGAVTLRVPVGAFESTLHQVRDLGVKVVSQQTSGQDVTSTYVDLQARIRALTATRSTFERLLAKATTIGDILAVQSRITDVQTQIERLQGQFRVLSDQADFASLTVTVDEPVAPAPVKHEQSGFSKALHRSVDRFLGGIEVIIGLLGPLLLVALLVALAVVAGRLGYRLLRRQLV